MDASAKVYELFAGLSYPKDKLLNSTYKRDIKEFEFSKEEREKIKAIYTVFNLDGKLHIFLLEVTTLSIPTIRAITKVFAERYQRLLLILTPDYKNYSFVFPEYEKIEAGKHKLKVTKLIFDRENPYHTDLETVCNLSLTGREENWRDIWNCWKESFSVERVTKEFFEEYKRVFFDLRGIVEGQKIPRRQAHEFTQQLLNRLMFLYFIAKKRWLNNNPKFIKWYWDRYRDGRAERDTFFDKWLRILFLEAFNNRFSNPSYLPQDIRSILQLAPYLNGGLFKNNELDALHVQLKDGVFEDIFGFLEKYNFTIREDLPLEAEVAVDPEMLGKVYESLVNISEEASERGDIGIFYTPRVEVDFMCRSTVVEYLNNHLESALGGQKDILYHFVFDEDKKKAEDFFTKKGLWYRLEELLETLDVVDPACGSGAFLVGMLKVLAELYKPIFHHIPGRNMSDYELKKKIIGSNLYGVDVMAWAVHTAELRLWLQLVVESDLTSSQLKLEPLLPNLNLKLRVGDSLVQEIGGVNLHLRDKDLSATLKRKLNHLKQEKEKFYKNDSTCKFRDDKAILDEEVRLFSEIIDEEIVKLTKEKQKLEGDKFHALAKKEAVLQLKDKPVLKGEERTKKELHEIEKRQEEITKEIHKLQKINTHIKDPKKRPFVWDIDFAEIFGDKGGFDIVIGNPPYVRQEKIADPKIAKEEVTTESKREYKEKLIKSVQTHFSCVTSIDKKSDYYVYFYLIGLSLLNEKGVFCFITSNSWLDVGYGKDLQEFLLKYVPIRAIYDNQAKRSFSAADVNTIIALFGAPNVGAIHELPLQNVARFVMFRKPFEEAVNSENLTKINKSEEVSKNDAFRVFPEKQGELLEEGWEYPEDTNETQKKAYGFNIGKYEGNKWGGKYLRAPDIFFTILEKGKGKLVRLGDIAEVSFGIKTGANEFFYLPSKHFDIEKEGNLYRLIPKHEGLPKDLAIEEEFLKPVLTSTKQIDSLVIQPGRIETKILICNKSKEELKKFNVLHYIEWGETLKTSKGGKHTVEGVPLPKASTIRQRPIWYSLKKLPVGDFAIPRLIRERFFIAINSHNLPCGDMFFYGLLNQKMKKHLQEAFLNSSLVFFFIELFGRINVGGRINFYGPEISNLLVPKVEESNIKNETSIVDCFKKLSNRHILPLSEELEQEDRKKLDHLVLSTLGLDDFLDGIYSLLKKKFKERLEKEIAV